MDPVTRLQVGIGQAESVVSQIPTSQYDLPTPCPEWNVGQLIGHMVGGLTMFREVAEHGSVDPAIFEQDLVGADAAASLRSVGDAAALGWSAEGKIDGMANLPFGEFPAAFALQLPSMDLLVHSWDLATATGLDVDWNPELVSDTREFVESMLGDPDGRGHDFGPPVSVPDEADDMTKLVAFLGRTP